MAREAEEALKQVEARYANYMQRYEALEPGRQSKRRREHLGARSSSVLGLRDHEVSRWKSHTEGGDQGDNENTLTHLQPLS